MTTGTAVVVRLDSDGDVLLAGPAVRAVARGASHVVLLVSSHGRQAAQLLPGVDEVLVYDPPWSGVDPPPVDAEAFAAAVAAVGATGARRGVVLTSFHQSPLPAALLLRLAGVAHVTATSEDYPGSLLSVRHRLADPHDPSAGGMHEVQRALATVAAAGYPTDREPWSQALAVRTPDRVDPAVSSRLPDCGYVVVHPGACAPARAPSAAAARSWVRALAAAGHTVVVTGSAAEARRTAAVTEGLGGRVVDLGGRTTFADLAMVLARATTVVTGNTGPAHLAAAVGTPVVSAFAPVVAWEAWRPWGVPTVRLGDAAAVCAGTRSRGCPVPGHPCLDGITGEAVAAAVARLTQAVVA